MAMAREAIAIVFTNQVVGAFSTKISFLFSNFYFLIACDRMSKIKRAGRIAGHFAA